MNAIRLAAALVLAAAGSAPALAAAPPKYQIIDLGPLDGTSASQGFGLSTDGSIAVGRSLGATSWDAYAWTADGGMVALPNLAGRSFGQANDVNDAGLVVGTSTVNTRGSGALPIAWQDGAVVSLALAGGKADGKANGVNNLGQIVGSAGSGSAQVAALYGTGGSSLITATLADGSYMTAAYRINDAGLAVGVGVNPGNAAVNVGLVYDTVSDTMSSVGALAGRDGAVTFDISNAGHVVGASMLGQGSGTPFVWTADGGMVEIGLPTATSSGSARGVNDEGWVVGTAGGLYAVPFLWVEGTTYTLQSLLPADSGWDLSTNTSASAYAIGDDFSIVGTGVRDGLTHAYLMTLAPVPEPESWALMLGGLAALGAWRRRRDAEA